MWIRSQNKEQLYNCDRFMIDERQEYRPGDCRVVPTGEYHVKAIFCGEYEHEDTDILGTYESKERAIEVLDNIHTLINAGHDYVYQMPEK